MLADVAFVSMQREDYKGLQLQTLVSLINHYIRQIGNDSPFTKLFFIASIERHSNLDSLFDLISSYVRWTKFSSLVIHLEDAADRSNCDLLLG